MKLVDSSYTYTVESITVTGAKGGTATYTFGGTEGKGDVYKRQGALLIESGERSQVHLSLVLLLPDTRMQNDPPQGLSLIHI